jgi:hypothetical protein
MESRVELQYPLPERICAQENDLAYADPHRCHLRSLSSRRAGRTSKLPVVGCDGNSKHGRGDANSALPVRALPKGARFGTLSVDAGLGKGAVCRG